MHSIVSWETLHVFNIQVCSGQRGDPYVSMALLTGL